MIDVLTAPVGQESLKRSLDVQELGLPRTLIAVMENNQQEDGSIAVPAALRPWMGGVDVIRPEQWLQMPCKDLGSPG